MVTMVSHFQLHDRVEPQDPRRDDDARDHEERDHLGHVAVAPAEPPEHGRSRQRREGDEHDLPADHPGGGGVPWQVPGVVSGGVHPADAEPGHHHHEGTDHRGQSRVRSLGRG